MRIFHAVACGALVLAAAESLASVAPTPAPQAKPEVLALRAARLLDGKSDAPIQNAVVIIEGSRIKAVGPNLPVPAGAEIVDLGGATLLPGLIDSHTHLLSNFEPGSLGEESNMLITVATMSTAERALMGAAMGREDLDAGITTVRDLGNSGRNGDVALRDAINKGWVVGPRMAVSTRALAAAGGQLGRIAAPAQNIVDEEYAVIAGVDEARRAVRQAFYDGADCIKVIVNTGPRVVSLEEMKAIVEEAHRVGRKVAAHAIGETATRTAAEAGVDSIEHAYVVPDDVLRMMAGKKIFLVPTDSPPEVYVDLVHGDDKMAAEERLRALQDMQKLAAGNRDRLTRAVKAGVPIAAGSDMYYRLPGKTRGQASLAMVRAYRDAGMTPQQIIRAATSNAAELLGWQNRVGSIEPGKFADIIAVAGDPLQDISELQRVKFVMKGGAVIRNTK
jgi:imidazolonepropionase-like amidohydrolase